MNEKLIELIRQICKEDLPLNQNTTLSEDLAFDSMSYIQLVVNIETEFGFEFEDDELDLNKLNHISNINDIINSHLSKL